MCGVDVGEVSVSIVPSYPRTVLLILHILFSIQYFLLLDLRARLLLHPELSVDDFVVSDVDSIADAFQPIVPVSPIGLNVVSLISWRKFAIFLLVCDRYFQFSFGFPLHVV